MAIRIKQIAHPITNQFTIGCNKHDGILSIIGQYITSKKIHHEGDKITSLGSFVFIVM